MSGRSQVPHQLPWDPSCHRFPSLKELPSLPNAPEGAAWVWGDDDQVSTEELYFRFQLSDRSTQLGRLNLLTPERVKAAALEITTGEMVRLE